jgi:hypothetical protein
MTASEDSFVVNSVCRPGSIVTDSEDSFVELWV